MGGVMDIWTYTVYSQFRNMAVRCFEIWEEKGVSEAKEASEIANKIADEIRKAGDMEVLNSLTFELSRLYELLKVLPKPIL
jgi:hypothetical protein